MNKCITVSVVSHAHDEALRRLLADLATHSSDNIQQIIVTLNIPSISILLWINTVDWPFDIEVLSNQVPKGFSKNHNHAFKLSKSEYFCVINPDVELCGNPFPPMLHLFADAKIGCVYPLQITTASVPQDYKRPPPSPLSLLARHCNVFPDLINDFPSVWVNASFLLFPRNIYIDLNGFDEKYFMYCEDVDICIRLSLRGSHLVAAEKSVVRHQGSFASRKNFRHFLWHIASLARLWMSPAYREYVKIFSLPKREIL